MNEMKRIFTVMLAFIMMLTILTGCAESKNALGNEKEQDPADKRSSIILTIAQTLPSCVAFEYLYPEKPYCIYAYDNEGALYRIIWNDFTGLNEKDIIVVEYSDDIKTLTYDDYIGGGYTPQYELTATGVKKENDSDHIVDHIQIKSGDNTIRPFGSLYRQKIDNGDGTYGELIADSINTPGMVSVFADEIPKIVLDGSVSYMIQANGSVDNVRLLTPNGDTYTESETTFDALSELADGTYYVAFYVTLGGNCDSDVPQNFYLYEDIFCLVVGESDRFCDLPPYDQLLNLEVAADKLVFQRIATTPCIVYSNTPISDMTKGTTYEDRDDILATFFKTMNGKEAITDTSECDYIHYIYMFDDEFEDVPWHYRFAICDCGAVMITNNDELLCSIMLEKQEIQSILSSLENGAE